MKSISGSRPRKSWTNAFILTAVCLAAIASICFAQEAASQRSDLEKLLPKSNVLGKWAIIPNTSTYAKGDDLQKLYDGGYEVYTGNGVVDAFQQFYSNGKDTLIVTIHGMTSPQTAKQFYQYWWDQDNKVPGARTLKVNTEAYVYNASGVTNTYMYRDRYLVTVSVYIDGARGKSTAYEFMRKISGSIGKPSVPVDQRADPGK